MKYTRIIMPKPISYGITSKLWYGWTRIFNSDLSWRKTRKIRWQQPVVVAVGGNSLAGLEAATARNLVELARDHRLVITHGNGPQVGHKLEESETACLGKTINQCTDETQVEIGQTIAESIAAEARRRGLPTYLFDTAIIKTKVIVDPHDPGFRSPTKYIGREFSWERIQVNSSQRPDGLFDWLEDGEVWTMKELPNKPGLFRRVVASPKPISIQREHSAEIKKQIFRGKMVIAAGGGGTPVLPDGSPVEAVIDKDLTTALLCREIAAQTLIISTGVPYVAHYYGTASQEDILYYQLDHALWNLRRGQYPAGAMGEKIEAAVNALRFGVNKTLITQPEARWFDNEGTTITRGLDLSGRLYYLARAVGLVSPNLQRWLVA